MKLSHLIRNLAIKETKGIRLEYGNGELKCTPDPEVNSVHYRAQDVHHNSMFVAIPGFINDGHQFIDLAIDQGSTVVVSRRMMDQEGICIVVEDSRAALSDVSAAFFDFPARKLKIIGITGTNGKTTTAYILEQILCLAGHKVGVIGTINYRYADKIIPAERTTPESLDLQHLLFDMQKNGVTHVIMEVASHALALDRVRNCWLDIGVFTNISQDHLDFHHNMDDYWECKKKMFVDGILKNPKSKTYTSVINCTNEYGRKLEQEIKILEKNAKIVQVGAHATNDVYLETYKTLMSGNTATIKVASESYLFESPLVGEFNLENIICGIGACCALDIPIEIVQRGLKSISQIPGRLEAIENQNGFFVYVDYAHTPDALENVLKTLRPLTKTKLICVFGCGGDRDAGKRAIMGKIAVLHSDVTIVTSDNPRTENPQEIIRQIEEGITGVEKLSTAQVLPESFEKVFFVEADRREAIQLALKCARENDIVLIAGKGHENYQIIGSQKHFFDDGEEVRKLLKNYG